MIDEEKRPPKPAGTAYWIPDAGDAGEWHDPNGNDLSVDTQKAKLEAIVAEAQAKLDAIKDAAKNHDADKPFSIDADNPIQVLKDEAAKRGIPFPGNVSKDALKVLIQQDIDKGK